MNSDTPTRTLRRDTADLTSDAVQVQERALGGVASVIRLGGLVLFSSQAGDAWILDPLGRHAICLARGFELRSVPRLDLDRDTIEWEADYLIDGGTFTVRELGGAARTIYGYPTTEIERLTEIALLEAGAKDVEMAAAQARPRTGRNQPCPCGSGKKYKKCCLELDRRRGRETSDSTITRTDTVLAEEPFPADPVLPLTSSNGAPAPSENADQAQRDPQLLWDEFQALKAPSVEQMDAFLDALLGPPPAFVEWNEILDLLIEHGHPDLPGVFRRVADTVEPGTDRGMSYFYWGAAAHLCRHGHHDLLLEVAAKYRNLGIDNYDPDGLSAIIEHLLAAGYEAEALALAEDFLPVMESDEGLMPYALSEARSLIFSLRAGRALTSVAPEEPVAAAAVGDLAEALTRDLDDEIHSEAARNAADVITGRAPPPAWTRAELALYQPEDDNDQMTEKEWQEALRLNRALLHAARDAWQTEGRPPGCALYGLQLMRSAAYNWMYANPKRRGTRFPNLLDYLKPAGLEERVARACPDIIGVNEPRARLLIDAHELLARVAARHELISANTAAKTAQETRRLRQALDGDEQ